MTEELLFDTSRQELDAARQSSHMAHKQRLMAVLGDGRDWEYTGECNERQRADGTCACGHSGIRFEFRLHNPKTKATAIVGSTCIGHYHEANPALVDAIQADVERLEQAARDRKRAARELAQETEIQAALDALDALAWQLDRELANGAEAYTYRDYFGRDNVGYRQTRRVTYTIFKQWHPPQTAAARIAEHTPGKRYPFRWNQYKSKPAFLRKIREETKHVQWLLTQPLWER